MSFTSQGTKRTCTLRPSMESAEGSLKAKWAGSSNLVSFEVHQAAPKGPLDFHTKFLPFGVSPRHHLHNRFYHFNDTDVHEAGGRPRGFEFGPFGRPWRPFWVGDVAFSASWLFSLCPSSRDRTCRMMHELKVLRGWFGGHHKMLAGELRAES